jgi:hypothetical protein
LRNVRRTFTQAQSHSGGSLLHGKNRRCEEMAEKIETDQAELTLVGAEKTLRFKVLRRRKAGVSEMSREGVDGLALSKPPPRLLKLHNIDFQHSILTMNRFMTARGHGVGIVYTVGLLGAVDHPDGSSTKRRRARSGGNDSYADSILSLTSSQTPALQSIVFCCCFHDTESTLTAFCALSCFQTVGKTIDQPYLVLKPAQVQDTEAEGERSCSSLCCSPSSWPWPIL